jgi:hypothetical protein
MCSNKIELSPDDKLDLLLKWMVHSKIPQIVRYHQFGTPQKILYYARHYGILPFSTEPEISFEDYCKNIHFLNLVSE